MVWFSVVVQVRATPGSVGAMSVAFPRHSWYALMDSSMRLKLLLCIYST